MLISSESPPRGLACAAVALCVTLAPVRVGPHQCRVLLHLIADLTQLVFKPVVDSLLVASVTLGAPRDHRGEDAG
jgi:hypothetical protein